MWILKLSITSPWNVLEIYPSLDMHDFDGLVQDYSTKVR